MKERYHITGMSCSACSSHVEKAVNKLDAVEKASVNLLTETMDVTYDETKLTSAGIIDAVVKAGYGASVKGAKPEQSAKRSENVQENAFRSMKHRLIASLVFLVILMYFSMGHMMWGFPLPPFLEDRKSVV